VAMTSNRPYLIRGIYDWLVDNGMTPYLLVNAEAEGGEVPREFVEEGRIVLNIGPNAVSGLELGNDWVRFSARFHGTPREVFVPPSAVLGLYARENGQGMLFPDEQTEAGSGHDDQETISGAGTDSEPPQPPRPGGGRERPRLKVVK